MTTFYKTIVLSDIHLGIKASKAKEVTHFLKHHKCETLILNGDIIDGWQLRKSGKWKKQHSNFFKHIIGLTAKEKCQIIYLRGNHDDFLEEVMPMRIGNFSIRKYYIHYGVNHKYFVTHGDIFDNVTTQLKWIAKLGDVGYTFLLWLNRHYNTYRGKRGLPYYSLSQVVKAKVKSAVSFISDYENELVKVAQARRCKGVICGHIHQPAIKNINGIEYLNSGDWVESLTALVEDNEGNWKIIYYKDWLQDFNEEKERKQRKKELERRVLIGEDNLPETKALNAILPQGVTVSQTK
ncbi:MAG: UDP-2,3-diacylglucosamine diphosphatase [Bacteroidetes bacterium]|nr:UDP-2,3-diacylglucosamine diphosphatase [Bacteroidota bacterium]